MKYGKQTIVTSNYLFTVENSNVERTMAIRKELTKIYGPLRLRGRHSNRKKILGKNWFAGTQNDINWKLGEYVSFYIHPENKNYPKWDNRYKVKSPAQLYKEFYEKKTGSELVVRSKYVPQF